MPKKTPNNYDIELPQTVIESFARFLIPIIKEYYIEQNENEDENNKDKTEEE